MATLLNGSLAVTVTATGFPATWLGGILVKINWVAGAGLMAIAVEVTERVPSPALMVFEPEVFNVVVKVPVPLVSWAAFGRVALESLELMAIVPV